MLYLAIDQHSKQITVCVRNADGDTILSRQVSTRPEKIEAFLQQLTEVAPEFMAILEVCGFNDWLIQELRNWNCREIVLIHPEKPNKRKTDRRDARKLADLLWLNRDRLDGNIQGWTQSLGGPNLLGQARQHVEQQLNSAVERRQHVEVDLQALTGLADRVDKLIDSADVLEMVRHLETILASGNPTEVNAELMQHVDRILVFPEGRVVIRCSRLGVLGAVGDRIVASNEQEDTCNGTNGNNDCFAVRQRPLPTRRICRGFDTPQSTSITGGPGTLPDKWVIEYEFQFERRPAWVEEYADEVRRRHDETGHSLNALAREFGKSRPTITRALEIAKARADDGDDDA